MNHYQRVRFFMTVFGAILCSIAIAIFKSSGFGLDPFQCMSQGVYIPFSRSISFGSYYMIWSFLLLILDYFLDKKQLGPATLVHLFLTGYIVDGTLWVIRQVLPDPNLFLRIIMLIVAIVVTCIGASLYFTSAQGVSVYDAISLALFGKNIKIGNRQIPFRFWRIGTDLICVIVGICFGLMPGIGTLITAFGMGPLIEYFNNRLARPMLERAKNEVETFSLTRFGL